jgi:hypothetical protein
MRKLRNLLLGLAMTLSVTALASAAPPNGYWSVNGNGFTGSMYIAVDAAGRVTGTLFGNPIKGFWSESSQRLMFYRAIGSTNGGLTMSPTNIQIYTAYKFPASASYPNGSKRLAGSFEAFLGTGATATRNVFGWYASQ